MSQNSRTSQRKSTNSNLNMHGNTRLAIKCCNVGDLGVKNVETLGKVTALVPNTRPLLITWPSPAHWTPLSLLYIVVHASKIYIFSSICAGHFCAGCCESLLNSEIADTVLHHQSPYSAQQISLLYFFIFLTLIFVMKYNWQIQIQNLLGWVGRRALTLAFSIQSPCL